MECLVLSPPLSLSPSSEAIDSVENIAMESADTLLEEQKLMAEAKYRQYMTNIDKALRNFEYSSEWADLIAALGKLSKVRWPISYIVNHQLAPRAVTTSCQLL